MADETYICIYPEVYRLDKILFCADNLCEKLCLQAQTHALMPHRPAMNMQTVYLQTSLSAVCAELDTGAMEWIAKVTVLFSVWFRMCIWVSNYTIGAILTNAQKQVIICPTGYKQNKCFWYLCPLGVWVFWFVSSKRQFSIYSRVAGYSFSTQTYLLFQRKSPRGAGFSRWGCLNQAAPPLSLLSYV